MTNQQLSRSENKYLLASVLNAQLLFQAEELPFVEQIFVKKVDPSEDDSSRK